jgi:hypothetical protein
VKNSAGMAKYHPKRFESPATAFFAPRYENIRIPVPKPLKIDCGRSQRHCRMFFARIFAVGGYQDFFDPKRPIPSQKKRAHAGAQNCPLV